MTNILGVLGFAVMFWIFGPWITFLIAAILAYAILKE